MNTSLIQRPVLESALRGLVSEKQNLESQIALIQGVLGHRGPGRPVGSQNSNGILPKRKYVRKALAVAEALPAKRKYVRKADAAAPVKTKRNLSAAARKRIALAQKKRWAKVRKEAAVTAAQPAKRKYVRKAKPEATTTA